MERLVDNALMYGSMVQIDQPHLLERYNQALAAFGFSPTKRSAFSVDAMGFSPEIAQDLKDNQYLDPLGINRRFIIVSPEQADVPAVNISFSSTIDLMRAFYQENGESIKNLTLKDVVYGEIEDASYKVDSLDDVLGVKRVKFKVHTHNQLLEKSQKLSRAIRRFETREDAWQNDKLLSEIVELARECGDIRFNQIEPKYTNFEAASFWTRHFEGVYVFHDKADHAVVVGENGKVRKGKSGRMSYDFVSIADHREILEYLIKTERIEPLNIVWLEQSGIIDMRFAMFCRLQMSLEDEDRDAANITDVEIDNWVHKNIARLKKSKIFRQLNELHKAVLNGSVPDTDLFDPEMILMSSRANPDHADCLLVNRFLSEFVPYDFLSRFIVNKETFYADYMTFSHAYKEYVVKAITGLYFPDKQKLWQSFFEDWR